MKKKIDPTAATHFVDGLPNADYHKPELGLSSSGIKYIIDDPGSFIWNQQAMKDTSKLKTIDFGSHFHTYMLEPEIFNNMYGVLPTFNRRKPDEKQAEIDMIKDWRAKGITPVTAEEMDKIEAMHQSALAHPSVAALMDMDGVVERSYFWSDKKTGIACKCRTDKFIPVVENRPAFMPDDCASIAVDFKTIGQIDKARNQIEELKYFVQEAFYRRGISAVMETSVCFVFVFVSTSLSMGRYPVRVVTLDPISIYDGNKLIDEALETYAKVVLDDNPAVWQTAESIDRPHWASRKDEDIF